MGPKCNVPIEINAYFFLTLILISSMRTDPSATWLRDAFCQISSSWHNGLGCYYRARRAPAGEWGAGNFSPHFFEDPLSLYADVDPRVE